ncbi:MAG: restriction endonuclease subunit S [bacterium]
MKLGEVSNLMTGGTPLTTKKEYYGGDIKWLVSGDINKGEIFDCDGRITELALKESNARLLPINSIMIALNGQGKTRGMVAILRTEAACNQSLVSINTKKEILKPEFLLYCLMGKYQEIRDINGDNQRGGLNMPLIRSLIIPLPSLEIQNQIVKKIEAERAYIDGTKKLIEIYEQKTKAVIAKLWEE